MFSRLAALPNSLKVVVWLNIVITILTLVSSVASLVMGQMAFASVYGFSTIITALTAIGILQASRFIRVFVLVVGWINVGMSAVQVMVAISQLEFRQLLPLITLTVNAVVLWGLMTKESKAYFEPKLKEEPPVLKTAFTEPAN